MSYIEIESENQFNGLLSTNDHVIVDFYASWCGPCKNLASNFDEIKAKYPNITILKVNIDEEDLEGIIESHEVSSLPHVFYYFKNNRQDSKLQQNNNKKFFLFLSEIILIIFFSFPIIRFCWKQQK